MDPESKLFYRKLLDFGPGMGFREGQRKFEEEMRIEDEVRSNLNQDIAMNPNKKFLDNFVKDKKIASHHFFDFPEDGEKINGMILGVPRKDIPETKYYDDDIMDFNKLPIDLAKGYSPLIPEGLRDKYKREADIDKYLKNMQKLKKKGIV